MSVKSKMTAIADEIRDKTGKNEAMNLDQMPSEIRDAYEAGKKAEYDEFWDSHPTANGTHLNGTCLFAGSGWNDTTFKPKYDIKVTNAYMLFRTNRVTDLVAQLKECGVSLDYSQVTSFQNAYTEAHTMHIAEIPLTHSNFAKAVWHTSGLFSYAIKLHTIDKIIVNEEGTTLFSSDMFNQATALVNITFEGIIGNSLDFQWCPLSRESITNIVEHLSPSVSGQTVTFKKSAKEDAFTDDEWTALIATKPNWTFALL